MHPSIELCILVIKSDMLMPHVGSGVERINPLCFLAGCRKRRLNQALSVLCLSLGFFGVSVVLFVCSVS